MSSGLVYNIQRMSVDDGPGLRTTVFLKGCPLRCRWCSNPESQSFEQELMFFENLCQGCGLCREVCPHGAVTVGHTFGRDKEKCKNCGLCADKCPGRARVVSGKMMEASEVMDVIKKDALFYQNSDGGVTFGGGEPTGGGSFLLELLGLCGDEGYHVCVDTSGYCSEIFFEKVIQLADLFLFDLKHMDPEKHRLLTGCDNGLILRNLKSVIQAGRKVRIRMPLMPELNDSVDNIAAMAACLGEFGRREVEIMPCHAFGRNKYAALNLVSPEIPSYSPEKLAVVMERFLHHGLEPVIV